MKGVLQLAEEVFRMPVRLGVPQFVHGGLKDVVCNPIHATGVGLLQYTMQQQSDDLQNDSNFDMDTNGIFSKMKQWFSRHF